MYILIFPDLIIIFTNSDADEPMLTVNTVIFFLPLGRNGASRDLGMAIIYIDVSLCICHDDFVEHLIYDMIYDRI